MNKKLVTFLSVVMVVCLALSACSTAATDTAATDTAATEATAADAAATEAAEVTPEDTAAATDNSGKTIAILMQSVADDFIATVEKTAEARAQELGYTTVFYDAKNDAATQASTIQDMITQGVDAIMLCPVDAAALSDSVIALNNAGIPVALVDRVVDEGNYVAAVESDNVECGYQGAVQIAAAAEAAGIDIADLKVLELEGDLSSTSGLERHEGFMKGAEELGLNVVSSLPTYWETDTAYNAALDAFQANPDLNAVFLASDGVMADAVINAFEQLNILAKVGEANHIIVVAVDGTPAAIEHIKNGYMDATVAQDAITMAKTAIDQLDACLNGTAEIAANKLIALPPTIGTISNIDSKDLWANNLD